MTYSDSAVLNIDLAALTQNYQTMKTAAKGAQTAAVVKANAYGLGLAPVVKTLLAAGCTNFFVALAQEGVDLRALAPEATIYVLNGLPIGAAANFAAILDFPVPAVPDTSTLLPRKNPLPPIISSKAGIPVETREDEAW